MNWHIQPSAKLIEMIENLGEEGMLVGPDRDMDDLDVDPIFYKGFKEALVDFAADNDIYLPKHCLPQAVITPLREFATRLWYQGRILADDPQNETRIVECDNGVLALQLTPDQEDAIICGMFTGVTLVVDPVKQPLGQGMGRNLVMARLMLDESLPTWDLDTVSYTPQGEATVLSAVRHLPALTAYLDKGPYHGYAPT